MRREREELLGDLGVARPLDGARRPRVRQRRAALRLRLRAGRHERVAHAHEAQARQRLAHVQDGIEHLGLERRGGGGARGRDGALQAVLARRPAHLPPQPLQLRAERVEVGLLDRLAALAALIRRRLRHGVDRDVAGGEVDERVGDVAAVQRRVRAVQLRHRLREQSGPQLVTLRRRAEGDTAVGAARQHRVDGNRDPRAVLEEAQRENPAVEVVGQREQVHEQLRPRREQRERACEPTIVKAAAAHGEIDLFGTHREERRAGQRVDDGTPLRDAKLLDAQRIRADGDRRRDELGVDEQLVGWRLGERVRLHHREPRHAQRGGEEGAGGLHLLGGWNSIPREELAQYDA